jgi:creatinine deaminase
MGENDTFVGGEDWLKNKGIETVNLSMLTLAHRITRHFSSRLTDGCFLTLADSQKCKDLMAEFIRRYPDIWNEDIGEE